MPNEEEMQSHGTGALRSPDDYRYVNLQHLAGSAPALDLTGLKTDYSAVPDLYQRQIGACTNHAATEVRMHREIRLNGTTPLLSPRFGYTLCKIEDGIADQNEQGTFPVMPFKIGVKYGFGTDATIPNDTSLSFDAYIYGRDIRNMPAGAFEEAAKYKIPGYAQVGSFNNITAEDLAQGLRHSQDGVKTCLPVGTEWWTSADGRVSWATADLLPIRKVVTAVSGHDITITDMDFEPGTNRIRVYFRNHWSKAWADNDNGWFYFDQHTLSEAWIISEIPDPILQMLRSLPAQKDFTHTFTLGLKPGAKGPEVQALQIALKIIGTFPFLQPVTEYYGDITKAAVMAFQNEYKVASPAAIADANGELGPKSRATLNKLFSR